MSAYDNDPRVARNDDGTVTVTVAGAEFPFGHVTYNPSDSSEDVLNDAIRSLIGDPA
jgi:hypothetical protein